MSHVTIVKTTITFKDDDLLRQALSELGTVTDFVLDYYNQSHAVDMAVVTQEFSRGIGFKRNGEEYDVVMDSYNKDNQASSLLNTIQVKYQQVAVTKHYRSKGYNVQIVEETDDRLIIRARGY